MKNVCQSCGQPLKNNYGTEQNGQLSNEYCNLCYENGAFKEPSITLENMQEKYVEAMAGMYIPRFIGRFFAKQQLPKLKRWNNSGK